MVDGLYTPERRPEPPFDEDRWELYHVAEDPSESHDLAAASPERLRELQELWWREAGRYGVLPLQSRRHLRPRPAARRASRASRVVLRPGAAPVPEELAPERQAAAPPHRRATSSSPDGGAEGVLVAQGGRFGGFSLYVHGRAPPLHRPTSPASSSTTVSSPAPLARRAPRGRRRARRPPAGIGMRAELLVDGEVVAAAEAAAHRAVPLRARRRGAVLRLRRRHTRRRRYESPFRFTGAIHEAIIDVGGATMPDLEAELTRAWVTQ